MKRAPRSLQHHVLYRKYNGQDSEISALLGKCGLKTLCGESRAAIYKYMDYEREQTAPSKWRLEALAALRTAKS